MGVAFICLTLVPRSTVAFTPVSINIGVAFFSISVSLNVLLTLMIVIRLALHSKNIKNSLGAKGGASGLYNAVITMLVESCALYAVAFVIYIGFWRAHKPLEYVFFEILSEAQVRAVWTSQYILGNCFLIFTPNRSLLHSSLPSELPTGPR